MRTASASAALDSRIQLVRTAAEAVHAMLPLQQLSTTSSSNNTGSSSNSGATAVRSSVAQGLHYSVSLTAHAGPSRSSAAAVLPLQLRTAIAVPVALAALMRGGWSMITTVTTAGAQCSDVSATARHVNNLHTSRSRAVMWL
jgi:hypothetical protein